MDKICSWIRLRQEKNIFIHLYFILFYQIYIMSIYIFILLNECTQESRVMTSKMDAKINVCSIVNFYQIFQMLKHYKIKRK